MKTIFSFQNLLIFFIISFFGILLIPYFQYEATPDGISYISIAENYISGNFSDALNAYWSPMISWTLIPFLLLKISPAIAFKINSIIMMVLIGFMLKKLGKIFNLSDLSINFLIVASFFVVLPYGFVLSNPDLLLLFVVLIYFRYIFSEQYKNKKNFGLICGLTGALAYLSKAYLFYFFIIHFILFNAVYYFNNKEHRKIITRNFLFGIGIFAFISLVWISILATKYGQFTVSTSGKYNFNIISPGKSSAHYMEFAGFIAPPNASAMSAWEDPGLFPLESWSPFASKENFIHFTKNVFHNFESLQSYLFEFSPLSYAIILLLIFYCLKEKTFTQFMISKYAWIFISALIYIVGYCLIIIEPRYLLPAYILIILGGVMMLQRIFESYQFALWKKIICLVLVGFSFMYYSLNYLRASFYRGKEEAMIAKEMKENYHVGGNIASDSRWYKSLYVCDHLNSRYFGVPENGINESKLEGDLRKLGVDYYIDWLGIGPEFPLKNFEEITRGKEGRFKIYKVK